MRREFWPARATTGHSREYWQRFTMIEWILLVPVAVAFAIASLLLLLLAPVIHDGLECRSLLILA
jgi:hypothetical protein